MANPLLIVGASVRAAAQSAAHAGFRVTAIDLFGDEDLRACCVQVLVASRASYPHGLADLALTLPPQPWLYTGGLENYPDIVARISARHTLLGNGPEVLRAVRDPLRVFAILRAAGLDALPVCLSPREIPPGETWLKKPLRSSGGEHVRFVRPDDVAVEPPSATHYFQRYQAGTSASAVFLAAGGRARFVGLTEQLIGPTWGARSEFIYAGSIGSLVLSETAHSQVERLGQMLVEQFNLSGLFGVDGVLAADIFWPVEINPRYTASMELYETNDDTPLVAAHMAACTSGQLLRLTSKLAAACHGKAVLYAPRAGVLPHDFATKINLRLADIPSPGTSFLPGEPICTILADGASPDDVRARLREQFAAAQGLLSPADP